MKKILLGAILLACLVQPAFSQAITAASFGVMKYFPGDVVHIIVEAPPDIVTITALMPDKETLNLSFSRKTRVWHNYWEVPAGFKKGGYTAKLRAVDVEGRVYEGESELFYVGEPTLPMVMQMEKTGRITPKPPVEEKKVEKPAPEPPKPKPKPKPKAPPKPKKPKVVKKRIAKPAAQGEVDRLKLVIEAREYYFKRDYGKLKKRLDTLIRIDPDNPEIKALRKQIPK